MVIHSSETKRLRGKTLGTAAVIQKMKMKKLGLLYKNQELVVKNPPRPLRHRLLSAGVGDPATVDLCALAIMAKAPRAGHVKTRLCPPLSTDEAALLNACFLRDTAASIDSCHPNARGVACFTPAGAENSFLTMLPRSFNLIAQRDGHFAERLAAAVADLLGVGFRSVCLIDSDSPTVPSTVFAEAIEVLAVSANSIVLGPAADGGYYLIGMSKLQPQLFSAIDWSTDRVLAQTLECATELQLPVHLLPTYYDVDDGAGLRRLCDDLLDPAIPTPRIAAPATREFLRDLIAREGRERIWPRRAASIRSK